MRNAAPKERARRGADGQRFRPIDSGVPPVAFRIERLHACDYGAKRAQASVNVPGFGTLDIDYFIPTNGREPFAIARSIKSSNDKYVRYIQLEAAFATELREAIEARLEADQ